MQEQIKEIEDRIDVVKEIALKNSLLLKDNTEKINNNLERINQNSYALGILKDYKKEAKKWFIAFIVASILLIIMAIHHFIIM